MDEQYRRVFEVVSDGIMVVNPLTDSIVETNSVACRLLGYAREDLLGQPLPRYVAPEYQRLLAAYIRSTEPNSDFELQALLLCKDGLPLPSEVRGVPITYAGRQHQLLTIRDLTAGVQAQTLLWEKEAQYRGIFEATGDGLLIIDPPTAVLEGNPAACRLFGYSRDQLISLPLSALVEAQAQPILADWLHTVHEGAAAQAQVVARAQGYHPFDLEIHGTSVTYQGRRCVLAVVRDITEQLRANALLEQRVVERTRELSTILEVTQRVASTLDLQPLLELILDQLTVVAEGSGSSLSLFEGKEVTIIAMRGPNPAAHLVQRRLPLDRAPVIWDAIRRDEVVIVDDLHDTTPRAAVYREMVGDLLQTTLTDVRSWLAVPLLLKERVIGMLALTHATPGYFTSRHTMLARAIATQAAMAIENARLYEQARQVAVLQERQRLARELHDSVSQALYGIALGARTARMLLDRDTSKVAQPLEYVLSLAATGLAEMRELIFELLPTALETEGLVAALQRQAAAVQARHGLTIELALGEEPKTPLAVKEALYRIAQEAVHNTVKHAQAGTAQITLLAGESTLTLEVRDDGVGFDPAGAFPGHLGQITMRERATQLGGSLQVMSGPGQGTRIQACIPI